MAFSQAAFDALQESAGQKFLRARGQKSLLTAAAATGGLGGGRVKSELQRQGIGFAQQDLQNSFGRLGQIAGQGQSAAVTTGQFGQNAATNIGNLAIQKGQARISGIMGRNQAIQSGISGIFGGIGTALTPSAPGGGQQFSGNIDPFARVA